jgi:GrpB-like predicted nucleotidyltransferase (UPF0157 family)
MRRGTGITIVPYSALWPDEFLLVRDELRAALPSWILSFEHVGSTSVPGLAAKPIIDLHVTVPDLEGGLDLRPVLGGLGFQYRPDDLPDRHYFPRTVDGLRRHHLSVTELDSWQHRSSVAFRNALRADADLVGRYEALKRKLASDVGTDRLKYLNGKTEFILGVLASEGLKPSEGYPIHGLGKCAVHSLAAGHGRGGDFFVS